MGELEQKLTSAEFSEWIALFLLEAREAKEAQLDRVREDAMAHQRTIPFGRG